MHVQSLRLFEPAGECVLAGHVWHVAVVVAPDVCEYVPASHLV